MADPPFIATPPTQLVAAVSSGTATLNATQLPSAILNLAAGTLLKGIITGYNPQGNLVLDTPQGHLFLKNAPFLKAGSEVVLRVEQSGEQFQARIVTVNGVAIEKLQAQWQQDSARSVIVTTSHDTPKSASQKEVPLTYEALAGRGAPASATTHSPTHEAIGRGSIVNVTLLAAKPDAGTQLRAHFEAAGHTSLAKATPAILNNGTTLTIRVVAHQLPQGAPSGGVSASPGSAAPATVTPGNSAVTNTVGTVSTPSPAVSPAPTSVGTASSSAAVTPDGVTGTSTTVRPPASGTTGSGVTPPSPSSTGSALSAQPSTTPGASVSSAAQSGTALAPGHVPAGPLASAGTSPPVVSQPSVTASAGQAFTAEVTGFDRVTGQPIARTPLGIIALPVDAKVTVRSVLTLHVVEAKLVPPGAPSPAITGGNAGATTTLTDLTHRWDTLREVVSLLSAQANPAAQQFMQTVLPQPTAELPTTVFFFMAALRGGDVRQWLGDEAVRFLEQSGKGDLLAKLGAEFATLRQAYTDTPDSVRWQTLLFPVFDGEELHQARLYVKRDGHAGSDDEVRSTRFVAEMSPESFGKLQFDGLFMTSGNARKFSLAVRSQQALPTDVEREIGQLFERSLRETPIAGDLDFQVVEHFPIDPMEDILRENAGFLMA